jgi:SpoVK/Ycf46/Vps4 family AAA+-type ATPase
VRGEVLVFDNGHWEKSEALYQAIRSATFDNLVLPGFLKQEIQDDFAQFFASREVYERYRIPWKRGLLFIGPPGNGKTHTVKALVNWLARPCLYVKSLKARYATDHETIHSVFERARQTTPCILVLEDLDSLLTDRNRSFFLNELDGFAANTGVVVLATTNHPDRLDPAILDRPSRFDRKYYFELPEPSERLTYVQKWNDSLEKDLRLTTDGISQVVDMTEGFSYAYLKELFLSSMMRWISSPAADAMDTIMFAQASLLREQMAAAPDEVTDEESAEENEEDW